MKKILKGYQSFREKYAEGDSSVMQFLSRQGQQPETMVVACCDSRVDPALILQCDPGDLFVVRNVANIIPPYELDKAHHGTSAALEFGVCYLKVKNLIILGHSQCGGIHALLNSHQLNQNDFITSWVSVVETPELKTQEVDECAKLALHQSYDNCMTFPWIADRVKQNKLDIMLWFFDIKSGEIVAYSEKSNSYLPLSAQLLNDNQE